MIQTQKIAEDDEFIDRDKVLRYGLGGAATGAGAAAVLSLINMLKRMKDEREPETDDKTIVLTLPRSKMASDRSEAGVDQPVQTAPTSGKMPNEEAGVKETKMVASSGKAKKETYQVKHMNPSKGQVREPSGKYGIKIQKQAAWPTLTASLLAAGTGGILGYKIVDKIYEMRQMKKKEEELDKAKEEYLDLLGKAASDDSEKQAKGDFNLWDYPAGLGALALILGGGGTAYLTKKILDEQTRQPEPEDVAKIQKIVFRTAPEREEDDEEGYSKSAADKEAHDEAVDIFKSALGVMLDVCESKHNILKEASVAEELDRLDMSAADLYKMAGEDYNTLVATLQHNPELRKLITRASMDKHPLLKYFKWAAGLPGVRHFADKKIYEDVAKRLGPTVPVDKVAGVLDMLGSITASTIGSNIAEKDNEAVERAREKEEEIEEDTGIDIGAADPAAAAFIIQNEDKIRKVIETLKAQGKI
jgi:hypothetical protein